MCGVVRCVVPSDAEQILDLYLRNEEEMYECSVGEILEYDRRAYGSDYYFLNVGNLEKYIEGIDSDRTLFLVYEEDGRIVGFVLAHVGEREGVRIGYIEELHVDREYRSRGVGSRLLEEAHEWLKAKGAISVFAEVFEKSYGFFKKKGYILTDFCSFHLGKKYFYMYRDFKAYLLRVFDKALENVVRAKYCEAEALFKKLVNCVQTEKDLLRFFECFSSAMCIDISTQEYDSVCELFRKYAGEFSGSYLEKILLSFAEYMLGYKNYFLEDFNKTVEYYSRAYDLIIDGLRDFEKIYYGLDGLLDKIIVLFRNFAKYLEVYILYSKYRLLCIHGEKRTEYIDSILSKLEKIEGEDEFAGELKSLRVLVTRKHGLEDIVLSGYLTIVDFAKLKAVSDSFEEKLSRIKELGVEVEEPLLDIYTGVYTYLPKSLFKVYLGEVETDLGTAFDLYLIVFNDGTLLYLLEKSFRSETIDDLLKYMILYSTSAPEYRAFFYSYSSEISNVSTESLNRALASLISELTEKIAEKTELEVEFYNDENTFGYAVVFSDASRLNGLRENLAFPLIDIVTSTDVTGEDWKKFVYSPKNYKVYRDKEDRLIVARDNVVVVMSPNDPPWIAREICEIFVNVLKLKTSLYWTYLSLLEQSEKIRGIKDRYKLIKEISSLTYSTRLYLVPFSGAEIISHPEYKKVLRVLFEATNMSSIQEQVLSLLKDLSELEATKISLSQIKLERRINFISILLGVITVSEIVNEIFRAVTGLALPLYLKIMVWILSAAILLFLVFKLD